MKKFYACEPSILNDYLKKRADAKTTYNSENIQAGFFEDLQKKAESMNDILNIDVLNKHATINISGVLVNRDPDIFDAFFDEKVCSYNAIQNAVYEIIDNECKSATIYFDTPGGNVSGVEKTRNELKALSELVSVEAVNVGMCCSAGMWLSSAIGNLKASDKISTAGSIGVVVVGYSDEGYLSNWGIERHVITNTESSDKIPDISKESGRAIIKDELDAFYDVFRQNVSEGFGLSSEKIDALKGRVLIGDNAIEYGLMSNGYKNKSKSSSNLTAQKTEQTPVKTAVNNTIPAQREKTEETVMSLKDLLSANPAAQKEHDEIANAKFEAGKKSVQSAVDGAAKYLRPDSTYGKVIKNFAVDVLEGKKSIEALESAVAAVDAIKESQNSEKAQDESEVAGAQTGQQVAAVSPDGQNKTEADYQAMIAEAKTAIGMEA